LTVQQVLNYEAKSSYSVRLRVTDSGGLSHEKVIPIAVEDVNEAPTTIGLSNSSVSESAASGSTVGTLTTADEDAKETATFTLVSGTGSTDNGNFTIDGTTLKTATTLVYATKSSHSIRVRVTDKGGLTYEKQFTIQVTEVGANTAPTDISLSASSLAENAGANADVGTLSATDADAGDTATFTLVSGSGSTDNAAFNISGTSLRANTSFDFETKSSYSVRVRVTDSGDATYEKTFAISVLDIDDTAPIAPTGLASSLVTATSATVSWTESTDNVGVTGYEVYNGATLAGTTTGATTFNLTGLASGSTNSITVVAIDVANNKSASSTILTVNLTDILPPSVPSGLTSSNVTQSGFTVTWTASTDNRAVKSYNVYRNGAYVTNVSTNSYKLSGLTALTSYSIRVLAIDAAGNRSPQSAAFTATTSAPADVVVPSTPSGLTATSVLSNRLLLTWTPSIDNVGVTGYNVYVNNVYLKTVTAAQTDLTGLTPLTTYSIQVQALDALKNRSARSTALSVTTLAPPDTTVPTAPTNLTSSNLTGASVTVRWDGSTDNVGVTGYNVYVNGVYNKTTTTRATTITGLSNMTTYAITVLAFDAAKNRSVLSSAISITTLDSTAPTAPTNVASSNVTKTSVRVTWTTATDNVAVTNYNIYRNGAYVATVSGTATSYNLTGLAAGTTYNITVRALDAAKNFTNSTVLSVTTLP
jgi:chitodextrinase